VLELIELSGNKSLLDEPAGEQAAINFRGDEVHSDSE